VHDAVPLPQDFSGIVEKDARLVAEPEFSSRATSFSYSRRTCGRRWRGGRGRMEQYLAGELRRVAERPSLEKVLDRAGRHRAVGLVWPGCG
jgi:hypothetical protein